MVKKSGYIIFLITIVLTSPLTMSAEIEGVRTAGKSMTELTIHFSGPRTHPKLLIVGVPIGETITVDSLVTMDAFVDSVCRQAHYFINECYGLDLTMCRIYRDYWSTKSTSLMFFYPASRKLIEEMDKAYEECRQELKFGLVDETYVTITYYDVYGFYIYGNKETFPCKGTSLGIDYDDNEYVTEFWLPMSIACWGETSSPPIVFVD